MLKKIYRLNKNSAFSLTYKNNNIIANKFFKIYIGKEKKDLSTYTRFGFVVSKKCSKKAVIRNRLKRLLREIIRIKIKENNLSNEINYLSLIIIPKKDCYSFDFKLNDLEYHLNKILSKIR